MEPIKAKVYTLLGFAQKSGKIISGTNTVESMIGKPDTKLVILADDSSDSFRKHLVFKCNNVEQRYVVFGTKDELGNAIGKSQRAVIIVKDNNIANAISDILSNGLA